MRSRVAARVALATVAVAAAVSFGSCGGRTQVLTVAAGDHSGDEHRGDHRGNANGQREQTERSDPTVGCPARFGELGPRCEEQSALALHCEYPEGSCGCGTATWCGGAYPPPMPVEWLCHARRARCASEGEACSQEGAFCQTDDCGFTGMRCRGGAWHGEMGPLPP